jgi:hypothetical protein
MLILRTSLLRGLQFARTHTLEPLDVTPDGGEVLVPFLGNGDNVFDPHTPNAFIPPKGIMIDVFGSAN